MKVYNTLSGKKEELRTIAANQVNIYVCGPTTYNFIHLGNARPLVVFDTVRRYLAYRGYTVKYVQNFTDVDDKIINRARKENDDPLQLAKRYIDEYFVDADALGICRADVHPRVSDHIPEIIGVIEGLMAKGYAYEVNGDVYYRVKNFSGYGKLSGRSLDEMLAGARVEVDERKEEAADFALWKKTKEGEPSWPSPWGEGRPGWHIECSVMSMKYLGETIDIHGGGADLIFPHHENEIAQTEAYTGKPFVKYWMHNGFITVNSEKMSKSLGNFFILRDILEKFPHDVVRYYLVATHYRSPLDFDDGKLEEARKALSRLKTTLNLAEEFLLHHDLDMEKQTLPDTEGELSGSVKALQEKYITAMDDDFNTAQAIGHLFEISHLLNSFVANADPKSVREQVQLQQALQIFRDLGGILGIFMETKNEDLAQAVDAVLDILLEVRNYARQEKNYGLADSVRKSLQTMGVKVEDKAIGESVCRYESAPEMELLMGHILQMRRDLKKQKNFQQADYLRDRLKTAGIIIEDTKEGARWKFADA
ncbi:MAG TPA: cysteine--tRNA ligase [Syntrophomonas sp.]|nr:cysteine--tRNA ligase [Syntrophomonas sp.]HRW11700.1 cysteine--tRNA ligase [Syntrophomonas sp.]